MKVLVTGGAGARSFPDWDQQRAPQAARPVFVDI